jgi:DNA-directed RNA polymerase subunit RPC12/RpoP
MKLTVRAEDAGRRGQCHTCGKVFRIGAPPAAAGGQRPPVEPSNPASAKSAPAPATAAPSPKSMHGISNDHLHPIICERCQTLMYASDDQVGQMLPCPDCGHRNLARPRPAKRPPPRVMVDDGDEYQLDESSAPPPTPVFMTVEAREAEGRAAARARAGVREPEPDPFDDEAEQPTARPAAKAAHRPRPATAPAANSSNPPCPAATPAQPARKKPQRSRNRPAVPVMQGVFPMLFTAELLVRWIGLSLVLTGVLFALGFVANAMGAMVVAALWIFAGGCALAGMWVVSGAPLLLAIVTQSAAGSDELHDPPNWADFEFAEAGFFVIAVSSSGVPAWLASKAADTLPMEAQAAIGFGLWLITFPFVVLSALEQGSPLAIFSPRIAASFGRCFIPWAAFAFAALCWSALAGGMIAFLLTRGSMLAAIPIPWIIVAWLFIYMRLIGRLAWWIADVTPAPEVEND